MKANNGARTQEMRASDIKQHIWLSSRDKSVRGSHQRMDGEVTNINEPFSNGLMYPGDTRGSAQEVVNCRCVTNAIIPPDNTEL